jgi:hypothetical protein
MLQRLIVGIIPPQLIPILELIRQPLSGALQAASPSRRIVIVDQLPEHRRDA